MRALTVEPGHTGSLRLVDDHPEPHPDEGEVLVRALAVGVCGTDREIVSARYGEAPPGRRRLVIGHESLGRVLADPTGTFQPGDLVAGIVRHPDPVPCASCAAGEWDMCLNGRYTEHGIKGLDGFARERWRIAPDFAVRLDPKLAHVGALLEPTSVVAKAWEQIGRIGSRAHWSPRTALVTGAGPIGMLAALIGVQRGYDVHVLDLVTEGLKPDLVRRLGATYHATAVADLDIEPDIVIEATGVPAVVFDVLDKVGPAGIVSLTGVSSGGRQVTLDGGLLNRTMVLENNVVFGSVNANRRHWRLAATALADADPDWLAALITRRTPVDGFADAYARHAEDIKSIVEFADAGS